MQFSQEIEERIKAYFERRFGYVLTDEQAHLTLKRLTSLAVILTDIASAGSIDSEHQADEPASSTPWDQPKGCKGPMAAPGIGGRASGSALHARRAGCVAPEDGREEKRQTRGNTEPVAQWSQSAIDDSSDKRQVT